LARVYLPRGYGVSYAPYIAWQLSLHRMATFPTWLGNPPYIAWQDHFCIWLRLQDFLATFFVYKFFYKFLYKFFYNSSRTV
jgi:hypothetical protein